MDKPKRIQRKRAKGWRMPTNTVYVGRPTQWGNNYIVGESMYLGEPITTAQKAVDAFEDFYFIGSGRSLQLMQKINRQKVKELRGKDLACWCGLDCACHADVLLKWANADD